MRVARGNDRRFRLSYAIQSSWQQAGRRRSIQLDQRGFAETFTPGAAEGQLIVEWLPAKGNLGHHHVGAVVKELFKPHRPANNYRVQANNTHFGAEQRDAGLPVDRVVFTSGMCDRRRRTTDDVAD